VGQRCVPGSLKESVGATDCSLMGTLAMICGLVGGGALMMIQVRHMGSKSALFGSLLDREVREALGQPLDRHGKRLLIISAFAFSLCILFLVLDHS